MTEALSHHGDTPEDITVPSHPRSFEVLPGENLDESVSLFSKALHAPLEDRVPITSSELHALKRRDTEAVSSHVVTTVLLRCAGDETTVSAYDSYQKARDELGHLKRIQQKTKITIDQATAILEAAETAAQPYVEVLSQVDPYAVTYRNTFVKDTGVDTAQVIAQIYDPTEHIVHPAIDDLKATRPIIGDNSILAERMLRMILLENVD